MRASIGAGRVPRRGAGNRTILPSGGRKYVVLADAAGRLSPAGEWYYATTGAQRPRAAFSQDQELIRRGGNDYIRTRDQREALVRSLRADGSTRLTQLGRAFFRNRFREYVVHVPVIIRGRHRNGRDYNRQDWLPVHHLGISGIMESEELSEEQAHARVRSRVLAELGLREEGGETVLLEVSGETFVYDPAGEWQISSMSTEAGRDGEAVVDVAIRQPMAGLRSCAAQLPYPEHILPEAFEEHDDKLCVPRQLAALLKKPMQAIVDTFVALKEGDEWMQRGLSAEDLRTFCVSEGHPFFFASSSRLLIAYEPEQKLGKAVACTLFDNHCYMYRSARCLASWHLRESASTDRSKLRHDAKSVLPPLSDWEMWDEKPRPGHFWCADLAGARQWLLCSGRNPRVTLRSIVDLTSLTYICTQHKDGAEGTCKIRRLPAEADAIQHWLARLPLGDFEYRGEGLPSITLRVFSALLRAERRSPAHPERQRILEQQDRRCALCGGIFDNDVEWDHATPLWQTVRGQAQLFQAVCASCHLEKTALEGRQSRTLESRFSPHVWQTYVLSPRHPPLVFEAHAKEEKGELFEVDVRRCRRNALAKSAHPWPIFSPFDSIREAVPGQLADLSYVVLPRTKKSRLNQLPWLGAAWYARPSVEWMLHVGLARWEDIKFSLHASAHVPPTSLAQVLDIMEEAWEDVHLKKYSVNAMVGLWSTEQEHVYSVRTSDRAEDCQGHHMKRLVAYGDGKHTTDYLFATRLIGNSSWRPIWDFVIATEHTRVAQMRWVAERLGVPLRAVRQIKTDCLVLQPARKLFPKLMAMGEIRHCDLAGLTQAHLDKGQTRLDESIALAPNVDEAPVFRWTRGSEVRWLQGYHREPELNVPAPPSVPPWRELCEEEALEAARGTGLLVCGCPGVGKSFWARELVAQLRAEGKIVHCIAKTHLACKNFQMGCETADHWCIKRVQSGDCASVQYLFVEEASQINVQLWADLCVARQRGLILVCLADFGQFQAIAENWAGTPLPPHALQDSDMLRELCGGNRFTLTENRRSDPPLFDFITSLRPGTPQARPLAEALADARARFPGTAREADWVLCLSHRKRMALNRHMNQRRKPRDAIFFRHRHAGDLTGNQPQSMWLWPGITLIGAGGPCPRGILCQVTALSEEEVTLSHGATLSREQICKCTRLAHCLCDASVQGLTLPGGVRLEDTDSPLFCLRKLYVGVSRATAASLVEVGVLFARSRL